MRGGTPLAAGDVTMSPHTKQEVAVGDRGAVRPQEGATRAPNVRPGRDGGAVLVPQGVDVAGGGGLAVVQRRSGAGRDGTDGEEATGRRLSTAASMRLHQEQAAELLEQLKAAIEGRPPTPSRGTQSAPSTPLRRMPSPAGVALRSVTPLVGKGGGDVPHARPEVPPSVASSTTAVGSQFPPSAPLSVVEAEVQTMPVAFEAAPRALSSSAPASPSVSTRLVFGESRSRGREPHTAAGVPQPTPTPPLFASTQPDIAVAPTAVSVSIPPATGGWSPSAAGGGRYLRLTPRPTHALTGVDSAAQVSASIAARLGGQIATPVASRTAWSGVAPTGGGPVRVPRAATHGPAGARPSSWRPPQRRHKAPQSPCHGSHTSQRPQATTATDLSRTPAVLECAMSEVRVAEALAGTSHQLALPPAPHAPPGGHHVQWRSPPVASPPPHNAAPTQHAPQLHPSHHQAQVQQVHQAPPQHHHGRHHQAPRWKPVGAPPPPMFGHDRQHPYQVVPPSPSTPGSARKRRSRRPPPGTPPPGSEVADVPVIPVNLTMMSTASEPRTPTSTGRMRVAPLPMTATAERKPRSSSDQDSTSSYMQAWMDSRRQEAPAFSDVSDVAPSPARLPPGTPEDRLLMDVQSVLANSARMRKKVQQRIEVSRRSREAHQDVLQRSQRLHVRHSPERVVSSAPAHPTPSTGADALRRARQEAPPTWQHLLDVGRDGSWKDPLGDDGGAFPAERLRQRTTRADAKPERPRQRGEPERLRTPVDAVPPLEDPRHRTPVDVVPAAPLSPGDHLSVPGGPSLESLAATSPRSRASSLAFGLAPAWEAAFDGVPPSNSQLDAADVHARFHMPHSMATPPSSPLARVTVAAPVPPLHPYGPTHAAGAAQETQALFRTYSFMSPSSHGHTGAPSPKAGGPSSPVGQSPAFFSDADVQSAVDRGLRRFEMNSRRRASTSSSAGLESALDFKHSFDT